MTLALTAAAVAWLNIAVGLSLAVLRTKRRRVSSLWLKVHPAAAVVVLVCAWWAAVTWAGPTDLLFNAGAFVLTLVFVIGGLLYLLGRAGAPPLVLIYAVHGLAALGGAVLLTVGVARMFTG